MTSFLSCSASGTMRRWLLLTLTLISRTSRAWRMWPSTSCFWMLMRKHIKSISSKLIEYFLFCFCADFFYFIFFYVFIYIHLTLPHGCEKLFIIKLEK
ncbi:UNVERIFIED_CONTAM: hypothetical protein GTU68_020601 [Idotea baltica]|nr:hypothetical protein [Idotea baltica]